ncbi:MAG: PD-(D/E)XK nuclease family protein [Candidatus Pacearchaeota archaeon]
MRNSKYLIEKILEKEKLSYLPKEQSIWKRIKRTKKSREEIEGSLLLYEKEFLEQLKQSALIKKEEREIEKKIFSFEKCLEEGIGTVSASKLNTYKGCKFAFLLKYKLHLKPPTYHWRLMMGKDIHLILRDINLGLLNSKEEIINGREVEIIENGKKKKKKILGWKARWFGSVYSGKCWFPYEDLKYSLYYKGKKMLEDFFEREKMKPKPALVEENFNVILSKNINQKEIYYKFTGIFDKIDFEEDDDKRKIIITDYKTGSNRIEDRKDVIKELGIQFTIYYFSFLELIKREFQNISPNPKNNIEMKIYSLENGSEIKVTRNENDLYYLINTVHEADQEIRKGNFVPFIGYHCNRNNCDWAPLCAELLTSERKDFVKKLIDYSIENISEFEKVKKLSLFDNF